MLTPLGFAFVAVAAIAALRRRYEVALFAAMIAPIGSALIVAGQGMLVFYVACAGACIALLFRSGGDRRTTDPHDEPGRRALVFFAFWACLISIAGPVIFSGTPVIPPMSVNELGYLHPEPVTLGLSNFVQAAYVVLVVGSVFYLGGARKRLSADLLGFGLTLVVGASFYRLLSLHFGLPWPEGFFDTTPGARLIDSDASGNLRFRGVYSEPAGLATGSVAAIAFFGMRLVSNRTPRRQRIVSVVLIAMAFANIASSTSTTAVLAGVLVGGLVLSVGLVRVLRGAKLPIPAALLLLAGAVLLAIFGPALIARGWAEVSGRVGDLSTSTRLGGNVRALHVLVDTFGVGVGLGGTQAFAIWATLLAGVGLVGAAAFTLAVVQLVRAAWPDPEMRPVVWALVAIIAGRMISGSSLTDPLVWLSLGLLANVSWRPSVETRHRETTPEVKVAP